MLCRESFDHHSRLSRNTVLSLQSKPLYQVTITTTIEKMARSLITKNHGGEEYFIISETFGYGAQKNRLNETVPFIICLCR